jgi:flavodoxin
MKILIVYYSKTGNTKRVSEDLSREVGSDFEEIIDRKNRAGILNWFRSGRDGMKKVGTEIADVAKDPAEYDLVIAGSPIWGWNIVPAVRTYLEKNKEKIKNYAFFITSGNTDAEKIGPYFSEIMGREPLARVGFNGREMKDKKIYSQKIADFLSKLK